MSQQSEEQLEETYKIWRKGEREAGRERERQAGRETDRRAYGPQVQALVVVVIVLKP